MSIKNILHVFLENKLNIYFKQTQFVKKCFNYLVYKYPYIIPKIDYISFNIYNHKEWELLDELISSEYICYQKYEKYKNNKNYTFLYSHDKYPNILINYINIPINKKNRNLNNIYINHICYDLSNYPDTFENIINNINKHNIKLSMLNNNTNIQQTYSIINNVNNVNKSFFSLIYRDNSIEKDVLDFTILNKLINL